MGSEVGESEILKRVKLLKAKISTYILKFSIFLSDLRRDESDRDIVRKWREELNCKRQRREVSSLALDCGDTG